MSAANPFEAKARAVKAKALIAAIDDFFLSVHIDMPEIQLDTLQRTGDSGWAYVASRADVNVPSLETREVVLDEYRARVRRSVDMEIAKALAASLAAARVEQ